MLKTRINNQGDFLYLPPIKSKSTNDFKWIFSKEFIPPNGQMQQ